MGKIAITFLSLFLICTYCYSTNRTVHSVNNLGAINVRQIEKNTFEFVKSPDIKSVKVVKKGLELFEPVIALGVNEQVAIIFDDLSENPGVYSYSISHCNSHWEISDLFVTDYLEGFEVNEIKDYSYSTGTVIPYMHYLLEIPNRDVKLKLSGNYLVRIFNTYEPELILIQKRFIVYEPLVDISAAIRQPSVGDLRYSGQQMQLKLNTRRVRVNDPYTEIRAVVCKNYPFQGCMHDIKPTHVDGSEIDYSHPDLLIFEGGNEFRLFDTKNIRYLAQGLQSVDYIGGAFHVQLKPDENRRRHKYSNYIDFNGKYVVNLENSSQSHIEADYLWAYFTLSVPLELDEGKSVYLFGELTGWQLSPANRMAYSMERRAYEMRLLLKQGAYSYQYLLVDDKSGEVDISHFEGSHFDTENSYIVLVYYKPMGARYERCVGYKTVNTRNPL